MPKQNPFQLRFQFPGDSPEERQAANYASIEASIRERYPMTEDEEKCLPEGVRLARFVPLAECNERCNFGPYDHTVGWAFPTKVCLKDLAAQGLWRKIKYGHGELI